MPQTNYTTLDILIGLAYHSCAIKGNRIKLTETAAIFLEGLLSDGRKSVREFYEVINHEH